jgi:hypothetical protein
VTSSFSFSIAGVNSGTATEGITTDVTTTAAAIPFGNVTRNTSYEAAQTVTISSNGVNGYAVFVDYSGSMANTLGTTIADFNNNTGTPVANATPVAWASPLSPYQAFLGYHTADILLEAGTTDRFSPDNTYAAFSLTAAQVAYNAAPVTNESTTFVTRLEIGNIQQPGVYDTTVNFTAYAIY